MTTWEDYIASQEAAAAGLDEQMVAEMMKSQMFGQQAMQRRPITPAEATGTAISGGLPMLLGLALGGNAGLAAGGGGGLVGAERFQSQVDQDRDNEAKSNLFLSRMANDSYTSMRDQRDKIQDRVMGAEKENLLQEDRQEAARELNEERFGQQQALVGMRSDAQLENRRQMDKEGLIGAGPKELQAKPPRVMLEELVEAKAASMAAEGKTMTGEQREAYMGRLEQELGSLREAKEYRESLEVSRRGDGNIRAQQTHQSNTTSGSHTALPGFTPNKQEVGRARDVRGAYETLNRQGRILGQSLIKNGIQPFDKMGTEQRQAFSTMVDALRVLKGQGASFTFMEKALNIDQILGTDLQSASSMFNKAILGSDPVGNLKRFMTNMNLETQRTELANKMFKPGVRYAPQLLNEMKAKWEVEGRDPSELDRILNGG